MTKIRDYATDRFLFEEGAASATPGTGEIALYAKTDGLLYLKDDAGVETPVGSGTAIASVVAGTGIDVDVTDPDNPIVELEAASIASLALADTSVQPGDIGTMAAEDAADYTPTVGLATIATTGALADATDLPGGTTTYLRADGTFATPAGGGGAVDFTDLADVPASYTGEALKVVRVKATEDGLEFATGGGGGGSAGLHMVPVMAGFILPSVSGGATAATAIASAANQPDIVTVNFNQTTQQFAQFSIPMPKSWDHTTTITAKFNWSHPATTVNFGVEWGIACVAVSDGDTIAQAFGTAQVVADTGGTTNTYYRTAATPAITPGGSPAQEDTLFFRISRNPAAAGDTLAVAARLHSVELYITTNAETDA